MRKLVFVAVFLLGFCAVSAAQDVPQFEVFGGWNIVMPEGEDVDNFNGWEGTFLVNANEYAGAALDFSGVYSGQDGAPDIYNFLFGPQVRIPGNERVTPFLRALFGVGHVRFEDELMNENGLTMAFGGGVDINVNEMLSVRPAQIEFLTWRLGGEWVNAARFAAGVVIKIGEL